MEMLAEEVPTLPGACCARFDRVTWHRWQAGSLPFYFGGDVDNIKEKKAIVASFSGGQTSGFMCSALEKHYGPGVVNYLFYDTGAEHPKTYDFIKHVNDFYDLNITCLQGYFDQELGKPHDYKVVGVESLGTDLKVYRDMVGKYGTPSVVAPWCSSRMKDDVNRKYCNEKFGKDNYEVWLGIRIDEPKRLRIGQGKLRYLAEISDFEKEDINQFWRDMPFSLGIQEWLGNCVFCPKKSTLKIAAACRDEPGLLNDWKSMIDSAIERDGQERISRHYMYRESRRIEDIEAEYSTISRDDIISRIRNGKYLDTNSCSESCEVFMSQPDFFK